MQCTSLTGGEVSTSIVLVIQDLAEPVNNQSCGVTYLQLHELVSCCDSPSGSGAETSQSYTTGRLPLSVQEYIAAQINHFIERARGHGSVQVENDISISEHPEAIQHLDAAAASPWRDGPTAFMDNCTPAEDVLGTQAAPIAAAIQSSDKAVAPFSECFAGTRPICRPWRCTPPLPVAQTGVRISERGSGNLVIMYSPPGSPFASRVALWLYYLLFILAIIALWLALAFSDLKIEQQPSSAECVDNASAEGVLITSSHAATPPWLGWILHHHIACYPCVGPLLTSERTPQRMLMLVLIVAWVSSSRVLWNKPHACMHAVGFQSGCRPKLPRQLPLPPRSAQEEALRVSPPGLRTWSPGLVKDIIRHYREKVTTAFAITCVAGGDLNSGCREEGDRTVHRVPPGYCATLLLTFAFITFIQNKLRVLKIVVTSTGAHVTRATPAVHKKQQRTGQEVRPAGRIMQISHCFCRTDIQEPLVAAKVLTSACTSSFTLSFTFPLAIQEHIIC